MAKSRSVSKVVRAQRTLEGAGFLVHRSFPTRAFDNFDPFLLLDEMGPMDLGPNEAKGAPDHPHRGFETVTYVISGRMQHEDSAGNAGELGPGDVQWMTAGSGVIHSEEPQAAFARTGGRMHGFQLWVNLPARDKMMTPRYQELQGSRIPTATSPDGQSRVKVIAGEALGVSAAIETRTPILYHHWTLQPGARVEQPVPAGFNVFAYIFAGEGKFGPDGRRGAREDALLFGQDGDSVVFENPAKAEGPLEILLIGGVPLNEPVARYGPFVMNTEDEIMKAVEDFRSGRFGQIERA